MGHRRPDPRHSAGDERPRREEAAPAERRGQPSAHASGEAVRDDLTQRLSDLAREMQQKNDATAVMEHIVSAGAGTVPGAEEATVSLVQGRRRVVSAAATGERARRFDELQQEVGQGPCLDAMYEQVTVRVDDLATDPRWPELARRAPAELGMASMLCFQLFVRESDLGALNLMARRPGAFTDESERVGLLFASHAAIALADARDLNHVTTALANRDVIGQAKGILMERYKVTPDMAFALLARVSQETNRKLAEVAEQLAETGTLGSSHRGPTS
ncbi:GAF and ANTAR domain-containing protein [Blastococcus sp. MG754426]|uniref:GAF and ANTAR domain-containing protein n=1 Tax=unclassified Blastococcus TaxID=2619396 RepID=UPI001EF09DA0|nr:MULTISPECIES: GAF and ANTAR domain-containing protein [unclassified Blastococcus]MCF6507231.1 GAF and ANTAR domain-containing protein [Blastococcus sp. MG754426]MCF6511917.1 GAF and ANTAR domain-containing protein [Blastococcus sp. MG754427]MCF6734118.1 GAF and ANTAR domain-containing protein [Blastococcus sp. KM273129]